MKLVHSHTRAFFALALSFVSCATVYALDAPRITSPTHTDTSAWYRTRDVSFEWMLPDTVTAVRTLYDEKDTSTPTRIYDEPIRGKSFTTEEDGVFFMHVQFRDEDGWGDIAHRRFQIDTTAPTISQVMFPGGQTTYSAEPRVFVFAEDKLSGLSYVEFDTGVHVMKQPVNADSLYTLPRLAPGTYDIDIRVLDVAGNSTTATSQVTVVSLPTPEVISYTKHVDQKQSFMLEGKAYPYAFLELVLVNTKTHETYTKTTQALQDGTFSIFLKREVPAGVYEGYIRATDPSGVKGSAGGMLLVNFEERSLHAIATVLLDSVALIFILVAACLFLAGLIWYGTSQLIRFKRKTHRKIKEIETTLKANVQALRRDTEEFHTLLLKAEKKRELTKEEQAILKKFKKRLDITEKEIEKKLEQIG